MLTDSSLPCFVTVSVRETQNGRSRERSARENQCKVGPEGEREYETDLAPETLGLANGQAAKPGDLTRELSPSRTHTC